MTEIENVSVADLPALIQRWEAEPPDSVHQVLASDMVDTLRALAAANAALERVTAVISGDPDHFIGNYWYVQCGRIRAAINGDEDCP